MEKIKSEKIPLQGVASSMRGGRPENQDDWGILETPLGFLLIVCDGMGGGPGGKSASYIVKHEIAVALNECSPQTSREQALKMAVARAQAELEQKMKDVPSLEGMGSTFVALLVNKHSAIIAHAGDSRCYRIHKKRVLYKSQDHSLVAELVRKKTLTEEEARLSPQVNVITRGLGSTTNHVPDIDEMPYKKGDYFILCTDGVWGIMPHSELLDKFKRLSDIQTFVFNLSAEIDKIGFSRGGQHDNHTIAVVEMECDSELKDKRPWKKWALLSIIGIVLFFLVVVIVIKSPFRKCRNETNIWSESFTDVQCVSPGPQKSSTATNSSRNGDVIQKDTSLLNDLDSLREMLKKKNISFASILKEEREDTTTKSEESAKQQDPSVQAKEITQNLITFFTDAQKVQGSSVEDAQEQMGKIRQHIDSLMINLHQCIDANNEDAIKKYEKIDILMNNAGNAPDNFRITKDGFDSCIEGNFLGHVVLTYLLIEHMNENSRIIRH